MNKIIKRELEKIKAPMSEYDDNTLSIHFSKRISEAPFEFKIGSKYRITVEDYILNEPPNFTLSTNWNKGIVPISKCMDVTVSNICGAMIQFFAQGYDQDKDILKEDVYSDLWLPKKSITVLGEYKLV